MIENVDAHIGLIWHEAYRLARTMAPRVLAEDLVGDGWFGLVRAAERYSPSHACTFSTYAAPRIRGAMIDGIRARVGREWSAKAKAERSSMSLDRRVRVRGHGHEASRLEDLIGDEHYADADLLQEDRAAAVRRALLSLPENERTVLSMCYFDELTLKDIGRVLGVSEARISQIRTAALKRLRIRLRQLL